MATELMSAEDISIFMDSNGWTRTRKKIISGKNIEEILNSGMLPSRGSSHPENTKYKLDSANCEVIGNAGRKIQLLWTGTYISRSGSVNGYDTGGDIDPWDMGAQNVQVSTYQIQQPLRRGYNPENKYEKIEAINSAGSPLLATGTRWGREISFSFCKKTHRSNMGFNAPIINSSTVEIAGVKIEKGQGLLFPISWKYIRDTDDNGELIRSYYEYSVNIRAYGYEWEHELLDVGTLVKDDKGELQNLYRYKKWQSDASETDKAGTVWSYGSLADVIAAKQKYAGELKSEDGVTYWSKWQELPFEEVTEPMPLTADGKLDEVAMKSGAYRKIMISEYRAGSWSAYDLPKNAEGK